MFSCKVCEEKEKRISDLKAEILTLRRMVVPSGQGTLPVIQIEADRILSGSDIQTAEQEAIDAEANALLSGSYE